MRQSEEAMTTQQLDPQTETPEPKAAAEALATAFAGLEGAALDAISSPTGDQAGAARAEAAAHGAVNGVATVARTGLRTVGHSVNRLAAHIPGTLNAARASIRWTVGALQTLPDSTLRSLAATSVGLGAGLSFTKAGRLAAVVGVVPAVVMQAAIANRPDTEPQDQALS
jgi:hypothetical protein